MLRLKLAVGLLALTLLLALISGACAPATPPTTTQAAALSISTDSLGSGQIGIIYSYTIKAAGGSGKYTWSVAQGSLPGGLGLDSSSGIISGEPATPGTASFTVQVSDGKDTVSKPFSLTIGSISVPLAVGTSSLPTGEVGVNYSRSLSASGGSGKYSWAITNGDLPAGLALDSKAGVISGNPKAAGTFNFYIQVKDDAGAVRDQPVKLTIYTAPTITTATFSDAEANTNFGKLLEATGGSGTYTWSLAGGTLPDGLTIDSDNSALYGTPTKTGNFTFSLKVSDSLGSNTKDFKLTVIPQLPPLIIGTASLTNGQAGTAYSQTLKASGGGKTYSWSTYSGLLPDGLSLDYKSGAISGTPKTAGTFNFTIQVSDEYGATASQNLAITVK